MANATDKLRRMRNKVTLVGKLAELEVYEGTTQADVPYISVKGAVQCGTTKTEQAKFETFVQEYKIDPDTKKRTEKKLYKIVKDFLDRVKNPEKADSYLTIASVGEEKAAECKLTGSFVAHDYVNAQNQLKETTKINVTFYDTKEADEEYKATADIEGYIRAITPEVRGEDQIETGRLRLELLTTDFFGNIVPMKYLYVPEENADAVQSAYEPKQTATFYFDYVLTKSEAPQTSGGFGVKRAETRGYYELIAVGADSPIDEDNEKYYIAPEAIKIAMNERKAKLDELVEQGYQGDKKDNAKSSKPTARATTKTTATADVDEPVF